MIKECLQEILDSKVDLGDTRKNAIRRYMDVYEDDQLFYILQTIHGIVADDIYIHFTLNVGFRCTNELSIGRMPICNIFQRILNEKYREVMKKGY